MLMRGSPHTMFCLQDPSRRCLDNEELHGCFFYLTNTHLDIFDKSYQNHRKKSRHTVCTFVLDAVNLHWHFLTSAPTVTGSLICLFQNYLTI